MNFGGAPWQLLRNDQDQFVDISVPQGEIPEGFAPSSCTFGDVDGDGLVDLYIGVVPTFPVNLINAVLDTPLAFVPPDKLYMNKVSFIAMFTVGRLLLSEVSVFIEFYCAPVLCLFYNDAL